MDEGILPDNIYFFYGGESDNFYCSLEFIGLSPVNREFGAFLMSDLGRQFMTENKLSIMLNQEIFFTKTITQERILIIF